MIDRIDLLRLVDLCDELQIKPSIDTIEYQMYVHIGQYYTITVHMRQHKYVVRTQEYDMFWKFKLTEFDYCHEAADFIKNFMEEHK